MVREGHPVVMCRARGLDRRGLEGLRWAALARRRQRRRCAQAQRLEHAAALVAPGHGQRAGRELKMGQEKGRENGAWGS